MSTKSYIIDMDGVLVKGRAPIPGAAEFVRRLTQRGTRFVVLTNNSIYTSGDLSHRLSSIGVDVAAESIFTSAIATGMFLRSQKPEGSTAFVIGENGLSEAIHEAGFVLTDIAPEYVVLGETHSYNLEQITRGIRLIAAGAHNIERYGLECGSHTRMLSHVRSKPLLLE